MKRYLLIGTSIVLVSLAARAWAQTNSGLSVGDTAPKFSLQDQHGNTVSLSSLLEKNQVAIVFHRSADW